jgi:hypothetical protein
MNLNEMIIHFGLTNITKENDINIMTQYYWPNFKKIFTEITIDQFKTWIDEDYYGGWEDYENYNVGGRREMKMLYLTIRAKKPKKILEIGTFMGYGTNHMLLASEKNREEGFPCEVTTIDIEDFVGNKQLHNYPLNRIIKSSLEVLQENIDYDFIMQDGDHSRDVVSQELNLFKKNKNLELVWSHDYFLNDKTVRNVFDQESGDFFDKRESFKEPSYNAGFQIAIIKKNN